MDTSDSNTCSDISEGALKEVRRITWLGLWMNLVLSSLKFFAGVVGHSSVLVADAIHSLSDLLTDAAILIGSRFWGRPADRDHPYGHAKIEMMVTLFIGTALILVALGLVYGAVETLVGLLHRKDPPVPPTWLPLVAALVSIAVKEYLYQITARTGVRLKSSAVVANAWHHRSDALSSIPAALAVGACLLFGEEYAFLDPVGTIVVGLMVVYAAWGILRPTFGALLDAGATEAHCDEIVKTIQAFPEVHGHHKLRTRQLGPSGISLDVHVQVEPKMTVTDAHELSHRIKRKLEEDNDVVEVFIHIEPSGRCS